MKKITFILFLIPMISLSQNTLEVKKGKFYKDSELLNIKSFIKEMENNPEAFKLANSAKSGYYASNVLGVIGGFMVGWPLGTAIAGGDAEWGLLGAGAGVLAVSIPIYISSSNKLKEAANIYNKGMSTSSRSKLELTISPLKTGFTYHF